MGVIDHTGMPNGPGWSPRPQRVSDPAVAGRHAALVILDAVLTRGHALDDELATRPAFAALDDRNRNFVRALLSVTLRHHGQLRVLVERMLLRVPNQRAARIVLLLQLGAAQLLFLRTPAHAAVNTSVLLAEELGLAPFKGLVNAVLRRIALEGPEIVAQQDAAKLNTPRWLWDSWVAAYGEAETRAIAAAHLAEPPLDITVAGDAGRWAPHLEAQLLPTGSLRRGTSRRVESLPGYDEGAWWVQDAAAALPVRLLAPRPGQEIADLCAAPGGKTMQILAAGATVTAVDRSVARLRRLRANLDRVGLQATLVSADVFSWRPDHLFDSVLLDAPCTATGTLRRHPDTAWHKTPEDVVRLSALQARLLEAAVTMVKPGGTMVYCVCSLQPEEGEKQIAALLGRNAPVERLPVTPAELPGLAGAISPLGEVRTLPSIWAERGGLDGFFIARLRRI